MRGDPWRIASKIAVGIVALAVLALICSILIAFGLAVWWVIRHD